MKTQYSLDNFWCVLINDLIPIALSLMLCGAIGYAIWSTGKHFLTEPDTYWYPAMLSHVYCPGYSAEVYKMLPVRRWAKDQFFIEKASKAEVILDGACVHKVLKKWPRAFSREDLDQEQLDYLVEGFE